MEQKLCEKCQSKKDKVSPLKPKKPKAKKIYLLMDNDTVVKGLTSLKKAKEEVGYTIRSMVLE